MPLSIGTLNPNVPNQIAMRQTLSGTNGPKANQNQ